jgi:hypothetical protein
MSEQAGFDHDVFISYSHRDEAWVTGTLLPRLEEAGLRTCIDFQNFVAGKPALLNMQDAAKNSRHTLLVLTKAWVESEWTLYESLLIRTKDPAGLQRRTVPLRLQPCEIPEFISMLTWVDFTRPDRLGRKHTAPRLYLWEIPTRRGSYRVQSRQDRTATIPNGGQSPGLSGVRSAIQLRGWLSRGGRPRDRRPLCHSRW